MKYSYCIISTSVFMCVFRKYSLSHNKLEVFLRVVWGQILMNILQDMQNNLTILELRMIGMHNNQHGFLETTENVQHLK